MFDLQRVRASWQRESNLIDAVVNSLDDAQARQPIRADGWNTHDLLGHIATAARAFLRQLHDDKALPPGASFDLHAANERQRVRNEARPWPAQLAYWQRARDDVAAFLDAAPSDIGEHPVHVPWRPEVTTAGDLLQLLLLHTRSHRQELEQGRAQAVV
jgi:uncharacterized protein (TIGR03083 family)